MKKKAVNKPVNKRANKPLTSQKIGSPTKLQSKSRQHQKFRPIIPRIPQRAGSGRVGQRKIRSIQVHKRGGPLYNTSWRDVKRADRPQRRKVRLSGPTVYRKVQASRNDKTPLLILLQNKLMHDGRKGPAEKVFWKTIRELNRFSPKGSGYALFYIALDRLKPALATVVRRVGRNYYQVPVPIQSPRQYKMAFQWLLEAARKNPRLPLYRSLAEEVLATISSSPSEALKKKEALYRSVVTNRAYSHYRWV